MKWLPESRWHDAGLTGLALLLLLGALIMPPVELEQETYDYVIVFDITQSMNVEDYELDGAPVSRLAFAKHAVHGALQDLPCGSRIGLGAFTEYRSIVLLAPVEVCESYGDLIAALEEIDGRMRWGHASQVTKGVYWAMRAARDLGDGTNVIVLTDGHEAPPLDSTRPAIPLFDDLTRGAIGGWLIGVGGDIPRPIPKDDAAGRKIGYWRAHEVIQRVPDHDQEPPSTEHLSNLHEAHLQALARQVGFEYARLTDAEFLAKPLRDARFATALPVPTDLSWLPASLALLMLVVRFAPILSLRSVREQIAT